MGPACSEASSSSFIKTQQAVQAFRHALQSKDHRIELVAAVRFAALTYSTPLVLGIASLRGSLSTAMRIALAVALKTHSLMWCPLLP